MKHHRGSMGDRFKALIAYDPIAGLRKKRRRHGGRVNLAAHIGEQAKVVDTAPTDGQKEAGNYRKGHVKVHGLDISIENPRGSFRSGVADGKPWKSRLPHHYGYIRKTEGGDGDHVDVYLGPHVKAPNVFVIDQHDMKSKAWDEHKAFIGFGSAKQAENAYHRAFSDGKGRDRIGHVETMTVDDFKDWLRNGNTTAPVKNRADGGRVTGMIEPGNIDLNNRPVVHNPDGSISTVRSIGANIDGRETLLPTVYGQSVLSDNDAIRLYRMSGKHLGQFDTPENSDAYAQSLHEDQARMYQGRESGGAVEHMAEGGAPAYEPPDAGGPPPYEPPETKGGWTDYVPAAIKDVPHEIYEAGAAGVRGVGDAWTRMQERHAEAGKQSSFFDPAAVAGPVKDMGDTASAVGSAISVPLAPITGSARSLIGHPMAQAEHIVGTILNPKVAAQDDSAKMYETAKGDVDLAMSAARPKGFTPRGAINPPAPIAPEAAANTAAADEFGINLSRGQATGDLDTIRYEDMAARGAYGKEAQDKAAAFFEKQFRDTQAGGQSVGQQTARAAPVVNNPAEAGSSVSAEVADRAARARALQERVEAQAAAEAESHRGIVGDQGRAIDDAVRGGALPVNGTREAGEIVGQNVRDAAAANRAEFRGLYDEFGRLPGEFRVDAVRGLGTRVRNELSYGDSPVIVDDQLTPAASRAIQALDEMSAPRIQNRASATAPPNPEEIAGVNLRGIDQMRKKLVAYYQAARANPTDARAVQGIIHAFDGQIERAITEGLFSGDPRALEALQQARASYSRYRQTYSPQGVDDVGTAMRRIVERHATPEETANMIIGSGKIGSAGLPVRIADRLEQVLGADSDAWSALRQAMWQKASQVRNSAGVVDPAKSANSIAEFTNSSLARRMFTDQERAAMRSHAQGVRDLDRNIEQMPVTQTANRVREVYQDVFGGRDLGGAPAAAFRKMVEGTATPEEIANGVFKVIGAGNPGHVTRTLQAIERIVGPNSEAMSAVRQGVWQKLTQAAEGKDQPGAQKAMQAINEFLNGSGRTIAQQLYSPNELALMDRYAKAIKLTIIPKYARTNSDTAPALLAAARKYAGMIGGALGLVHGDGGLAGYGVGKLLDKAGEKVLAVRQSRKLDDSLNNVVPPAKKPTASPNARSAVTRMPLTLRGGPTTNIGNSVARLQGPTPSRADDEKNKSKGVGN